MKKIKDIILIIIIIALIIILANIIYSKMIKKERIISIFGKSILIVETGSMEPTIKAGELVIISKENSYKVGDIVTVVDDENYIYTHRIVSKKENTVITKGDGNSVNDEQISMKNIFGRVIYHSKVLGYFIIYLLKPLIIFYILIIVMTNIINYKKEKTDEKKLNT